VEDVRQQHLPVSVRARKPRSAAAARSDGRRARRVDGVDGVRARCHRGVHRRPVRSRHGADGAGGRPVVFKAMAARPKDIEDASALLLMHKDIDLDRVRRQLGELAAMADEPALVAGLEQVIRRSTTTTATTTAAQVAPPREAKPRSQPLRPSRATKPCATSAHDLEVDSGGRRIEQSLSLNDLFSLDVVGHSRLRSNLESAFGRYEQGVCRDTAELLCKARAGSVRRRAHRYACRQWLCPANTTTGALQLHGRNVRRT
jgi:hypothetical protein